MSEYKWALQLESLDGSCGSNQPDMTTLQIIIYLLFFKKNEKITIKRM